MPADGISAARTDGTEISACPVSKTALGEDTLYSVHTEGSGRLKEATLDLSAQSADRSSALTPYSAKPEPLFDARISAYAGCGHAVAFALGRFVPEPNIA